MAYGSTSYGGGSGLFQVNIKQGVATEVVTPSDSVSASVIKTRFSRDAAGTILQPLYPSLVRPPIHEVFSAPPLFTSPADSADGVLLVKQRFTTDSGLTPADAATVLFLRNRTAADTAPASDADVRQTYFYRTTSNILAAPTDSATRLGLSFRRTGSDSTTTTDSTVRTNGIFVRSAADSAPATDGATRLIVKVRALADTVAGISDQAVRLAIPYKRGPPEPTLAVPTDAATRQTTYGRTPADTVSAPTDVATRLRTVVRTAADSALANDADVRQTVFFRTATDSVAGVADSATRLGLPFKRTTGETTSTSDGATRLGVFSRLLPGESAPAADAMVSGRIVVLLPDGIPTQTNFTGVLSDIRHSVDPADSTWILGSSTSGVLHLTMENPADDLLVGVGKQTIRLRLRPAVSP